jgi:NUMOD3 motif
MNYTQHYQKLIEKSKLKNRLRRPSTDPNYVYYEKHHIIPKCIGGTNEKSNLVLLTPEEHYVAHQLLVKIYPERPGLIFAAIKMTMSKNGQRMNNKLYGWLRKRVSDHTKMMHEDKKTGMHNKKHTEETKQKMRNSSPHTPMPKGIDSPHYGVPKTKEHKAKLSAAKTGKKTGPHTEETKQKMCSSRKLQTRTRDKQISINGLIFSSATNAAKSLNITVSALCRRMRTGKFPDYFYL